MVHALEEIHRLLRPDGSLIDIHPCLEAPLLEIHQGGRITFAEPVPAHDFEDKQQAENALKQAIQRRLFVVERADVFDFLVYASSAAELRDFLVEQSAFEDNDEATGKWEVERAELAKRTEEAMRAAGKGAEVVFHECARITLLRPVH